MANRVYSFPWDDGSGAEIVVSYDPDVSTTEWTAQLSVMSSAPYTGSTSRSKVITLFLNDDNAVTATLNVVQRRPVNNTLVMEFRQSGGSWGSTVTVNSDTGGVKVYVRATFTHTTYDLNGKAVSEDVVMDTSNYGSAFVMSLGAGTPSFVSLGTDSTGVFIEFGKNTAGFVGNVNVSCDYSGPLGSASAAGVLSVASEVFTVKSILLLASVDAISYGGSVDLGAAGGSVGLQYQAVVELGDGSVSTRTFDVGSADMGGTLSGSLVGGTIAYEDYSKWRSVTVGSNSEGRVVSYSLTWSWEGQSSTVVINQAAANVVVEVGRYLVFDVDPTVYVPAGGTGSYTVFGFVQMSDGIVVPQGDLTSSAAITSSVGWASASGGTVTVGSNGDATEDRTCVLTASVSGYDSVTAELLQESVKELRRELSLVLNPATFGADGGSGTYTVRGVIYKADGTTEDGGDLTSVAAVSSGAGWLSFNNGSFTVSANGSTSDSRDGIVTATLDGWLPAEGLVSQAAKAESPWGAWTLTVTPSTYAAPAGGGSVTLTVVATRSRADGSQTETKTATWSGSDGFTATPSGGGFDSGAFVWNNGTVTAAANTGVESWSGSILFSYEGATAMFTATQGAASISYGVPSGGVLTVVDIPAAGGSVSSGVLSGTITQAKTVNGESTDVTYTWEQVTGGTWSAAVTAPSLGTTEKGRTKVGELTYSYVLNGVPGSIKADVYQEANAIVSSGSWSTTFTLSSYTVGYEADYVIYSGSRTREVVYTSGDADDLYVEIETVTVPLGYPWVTVEDEGGVVRVADNYAIEGRSVVLTAHYADGYTATALLTQNGLGENIYLWRKNDTSQLINWYASGTVILNDGYLEGAYESDYEQSPAQTEGPIVDGVGLINTAGLGQGLVSVSSITLSNVNLATFDKDGQPMKVRYDVWVELIKIYSSGESELLASYGSESAPMVAGAESGSVLFSSQPTSGLSVDVGDILMYRVCYRMY